MAHGPQVKNIGLRDLISLQFPQSSDFSYYLDLTYLHYVYGQDQALENHLDFCLRTK